MKLLLLVDRCIHKIKRLYLNRVFFEKTGQTANLIGEITLINTNLKIGKNVTIYPYTQFFGDGPIELEDNVAIGTGTIIYASKNGGGVSIGKDTMIAGQCYIIDTDHGIKAGERINQQEYTVAPIIIGQDVWIAAGVKVLKGSVIEDGAIIGAQSLVKGHITSDSIAVGIPAKIIKKRS